MILIESTDALKELIDRDEFELWLNLLPKTTMAGFSSNPNSCPMANYLNSLNDWDGKIRVEDDRVSTINFGVPLPEWLSCFISKVDAIKDGCEVDVYPKEALEILGEC